MGLEKGSKQKHVVAIQYNIYPEGGREGKQRDESKLRGWKEKERVVDRQGKDERQIRKLKKEKQT